MNLDAFMNPKNSSSSKEKDKSNRVLLLTYEEVNDDSLMKADAAHLQEYLKNGYEVQTLMIENKNLSIEKKQNHSKISPDSLILMDKLVWLKEKEGSKLIFAHHGLPNNEKENLKGKNSGAILAQHGLSGDLKNMEVLYLPCSGNKGPEATNFVNQIAKNAVNFLVEAIDEVRTVKLGQPNKQDRDTFIKKQETKIADANNLEEACLQYNSKLSELQKKIIDNMKLEATFNLKNIDYIYGVKGSYYFAEKNPKMPKKFNTIYHPINKPDIKTGKYKFNTFFLIGTPQKTIFGKTSSVIKTKDPKKIEKFRNGITLQNASVQARSNLKKQLSPDKLTSTSTRKVNKFKSKRIL